MIGQKKFHDSIEKNISRIQKYKLGKDGTKGECDCIGLIIGAIRLSGEKWPWIHGSNFAMRNRMENVYAVTSKEQLKLDQLVYKAREPGESGWALPSEYASHPDQRDYYHVGIVTSVNPLVITHCTSVAGGIKRDTSLGKWRFAGEIDLVEYGDYELEVTKVNEYQVIGGNLNMRKGAGLGFGLVTTIPNGSLVNVIADEGQEWVMVQYKGYTGYCMGKYLQKTGYSDGNDAEAAFLAVEEALNRLKKIIFP